MRTHILLNHHVVNTIYHFSMFQTLQEYLQVVCMIHFNSEVNRPNVLHILLSRTVAVFLSPLRYSRIHIQVRSKNSQVKTQLVLWIFISLKVTM
jgi:hypothetical protein